MKERGGGWWVDVDKRGGGRCCRSGSGDVSVLNGCVCVGRFVGSGVVLNCESADGPPPALFVATRVQSTIA